MKESSCHGHTGKRKKKFATIAEAWEWLKTNSHKDMKVYQCPDCKGYHIAHRRK